MNKWTLRWISSIVNILAVLQNGIFLKYEYKRNLVVSCSALNFLTVVSSAQWHILVVSSSGRPVNDPPYKDVSALEFPTRNGHNFLWQLPLWWSQYLPSRTCNVLANSWTPFRFPFCAEHVSFSNVISSECFYWYGKWRESVKE